MTYAFEVSPEQLDTRLDEFVSGVFAALESDFLVMPKGLGFVEYPVFEQAYERLKQVSGNFQALNPEHILALAAEMPLVLIVLRTILGLTPTEWGYLASRHTHIDVNQGYVRTLDREIRLAPSRRAPKLMHSEKAKALLDTACHLLTNNVPRVGSNELHRMDKADTAASLASLRTVATLGVPYAMLLYERFLGRPFAGHRDSVSELIGDSLESAVEEILTRYGISYRKTKRAERVPGFDQAPDFLVPSEFNPQIVIEAKVTEDDGTARDKVTRIQHLASLSSEQRRFQVIACIAGRGFGVRREDMRKLLLATQGKVFTPRTLHQLVEYTDLALFRSQEPNDTLPSSSAGERYSH